MPSFTRKQITASAQKLVDFVNESPSPYHIVTNGKTRLINAGFKQLSEKKAWKLEKGGKYFLSRNESTLIAFIVGEKFEAGNGITLVGTHTDSPCLRLKPNSKKFKGGFLSVGVQCYGGGLWNTWFDRDLTVAGRVMIKNSEGKLEHHLVHIKDPILRIPMLCVHLQRNIDWDGFLINKETKLVPVIATKIFEEHLNKEALEDEDDEPIPDTYGAINEPEAESPTHGNEPEAGTPADDNETRSDTPAADESTEAENADDQASKHHSILIKLICKEVGCKPEDLVDMELCLADTQPAVIGGAYKEFIFSPRLDNSFNSYCAITAMISTSKEGVENEPNIRMINCFDNEEVGSGSAQGAKSKVPELIMRRICNSFGGRFEQTIANSCLMSADQAFGAHPNYPEKYEENHKPDLHRGLLMDFSANQFFSSTAITASIAREVAKKCDVEIQDLVIRNDSTGGTTIGPIQARKLGMKTVDVGGPALSMHSIREMVGTTTVPNMISLMETFFKSYPGISDGMKAN